MARFIFIGDVHGCSGELDDLIGLLAPVEGDRLHFVGDMVDRGPDSVGVIQRVRDLLSAYPRGGVVCGNHEERILRHKRQGRELPGWTRDAGEAEWEFLENLPLIHRVKELDVLLIHGGIYPQFFQVEWEVGHVPQTWRTSRDKKCERLRRFLRVRRVSPEGVPVPLDAVTSVDVHWSRVYDGREGFVIFGHDPQLTPPAPIVTPNAIGIDTACCFGGRLTAAVIREGQGPGDAAFVSVPARTVYAEPKRYHTDG